MTPEEENRARAAHPKMREQIVDLLVHYTTHILTHTHYFSVRRLSHTHTQSQILSHGALVL